MSKNLVNGNLADSDLIFVSAVRRAVGPNGKSLPCRERQRLPEKG
jgi:hypothetical protein